MKPERPAVFLDKDGTLIENVPHNVDPEKIVFGRGADVALPQLHDAGFQLIVVSNQAGVAHGKFTEDDLKSVKRRLTSMMNQFKAPLDGFYYCPHDPAGSVDSYAIACRCRKPYPGLLYQASFELGVNLGKSWLIGDILNDIEAGRRAGCRSILLDNGNETEWQLTPLRTPDFVVRDLAEAAKVILSEHEKLSAPAGEVVYDAG